MQTFGLSWQITRDAVRRWRGARRQGLSAADVAAAVGVSRATLGRGRRSGITPSPARPPPMDACPGRGGSADARRLPDVGQGQDRRPAPTPRARGEREHHGPHPQDVGGAGRDHAGPDPAPRRAASPQVPARSSNSTPSPSRHTPADTPSSSSPPMTPSPNGPAPRPGDAQPRTTPGASSTSSRPTCPSPSKPSRSMEAPGSRPTSRPNASAAASSCSNSRHARPSSTDTSSATTALGRHTSAQYLAKHPSEDTLPSHMS